MRLSGRLAAAMEVLADMDRTHRPAGISLKDWGTSHRFAGAGDRAAIGNLVYDALRRKAFHAYLMGAETPRALVLSVAVKDWGETPESLNAAFAEDRFAPEQISDDELQRLAADASLSDAPDHVRANLPEWLQEDFKKAFGDNWIAEAEAFCARPPLDMRVNALKSEPARVIKALQRFAPTQPGIVPDALRIASGTRDARTANVQADESYRKGWLEIQDLGSQIVSKLIGAKAGEQVLDYCAGAGGKTLALAAEMQNSGQIFAHDVDRSRLAPIYDRLKRNGVRNAQVRAPGDDALVDLEGSMDCVVIDAPCTGTGTWRRRPDTKWRLSEDQLTQRQTEQQTVLNDAAKYVKPGGRVAYITCSVLPSENSAQVANFLQTHDAFKALSGTEIWQNKFDADVAESATIVENGLLLSPRLTGTDGFFIAVLERIA